MSLPVSAAPLIAGRYQLDRQVASDRLAEVWHGTDVELARPVAVKLLHADAGDADTVSQFRTAACRAAALTHEGLVRVYDYCEPEPSDSAQRSYLVMEYVDGQSLAGRLHGVPLGTARTIDIIAQVSAALQAVHQAGLAHGDISPEKILLSNDGAAKLFGFSGSRPAESAAIGADLRALGGVARQCLSKRMGRSGSLARRVPAPIAASVAEFVTELCASDSADQVDATAAVARRAAELRAQLGQSVAAGPGSAQPASPRPASRRPGNAAPPVTLTLARLPSQHGGSPAARTGQRAAVPARQMTAGRGSVMVVRTSAVIAIALAGVALFGVLKPNGGAQQADGATKAASVLVSASQLIGQPVNVARLRLQRLGLVVRTGWRESDTVSAGDVMAVRPVGLVPVHSVVVVIGSSGRPATVTPPDGGAARTPALGPTAPSSPATSPSPTASPSPPDSPSPTDSAAPSSSPQPSASAAS